MNPKEKLFFVGQKIISSDNCNQIEYELLLRYGDPQNAHFPAELYEHFVESEEAYREYAGFLNESIPSILHANPGALFSFNIDQQELEYPELFEFLDNLSETQRQRLTIELTENAPIDHAGSYYASYNIEAIKKISDMGYKVAFDDIGSGINTFGNLCLSRDYISRVKWSYINLSKYVSWDQSSGLIKFLSEFADSNQLDFVVEGIENKKTADELCGLGIKFFQGYLYSKPEVIAS